MLYQKLILTCYKQIHTERSPSAIYHLLTGKKSIQSVQDAHNYELTHFYGILPRMTKQFYDEKITEYNSKGILKYFKGNDSNNGQNIIVTKLGDQWLQEYESASLDGFNGLKYNNIDDKFFYRLLLLIQLTTNSKANNYTYIPIIDHMETTNWAKQFYQKVRLKINKTIEVLYTELATLLRKVTELEANMFVDRLTGYQIYGLSVNQLARKYRYSPVDIELIFTRMIHQILEMISGNEKKYKLLVYITHDLSNYEFMTKSAYKTYQYFKKGYSISNIAHARQLKINTIYDHLVEASLYDDLFPFNQYISQQSYEQIIHVLQKNESFKLKDIKEGVDNKISYFQIRLALSKRSREKGSS